MRIEHGLRKPFGVCIIPKNPLAGKFRVGASPARESKEQSHAGRAPAIEGSFIGQSGIIQSPQQAQEGANESLRELHVNERYEMSNPHIGSDLDDFLQEEGILEEVEAAAIKKVVACMIVWAMAEAHITKSEMARRMGTSRTQLDRLLDPAYPSVTLATIAKAATAIGKKISISFDEMHSAKMA